MERFFTARELVITSSRVQWNEALDYTGNGGNRPGGNFRSWERKNARKIKTNIDHNHTTNPNPKPTIDQAAKERNKVH